MTTSPDTVNAAEATTRAQATTANQATPASAGTTGGTVNATARTGLRPARPDMADEQMPPAQRLPVGPVGAVPLPAPAPPTPPLRGCGRRHPAAVGLGPGLA